MLVDFIVSCQMGLTIWIECPSVLSVMLWRQLWSPLSGHTRFLSQKERIGKGIPEYLSEQHVVVDKVPAGWRPEFCLNYICNQT